MIRLGTLSTSLKTALTQSPFSWPIGVTACRLAEHIAIEFQYLVGGEKQLPGDKLM